MSPMILDPNRGITFPNASLQSLAAMRLGDAASFTAGITAYDESLITKFNKTRVYDSAEHQFSGNDQTVTRLAASTGVWRSVLTTPIGIHDKVYFEFTHSFSAGGQHNFFMGLGNFFSTTLVYSYAGSDGQGSTIGWQSLPYGAYAYYGGSGSLYGNAVWLPGQVIAFALDAAQGYYYHRNVTAGQGWQPSGVNVFNQPVPGYGNVGCIRAPVVCVVVSTVHTGTQVTINFDGPFVGPVPPGYRRWNGTLIPGVPI
jgi:hypothetical protein